MSQGSQPAAGALADPTPPDLRPGGESPRQRAAVMMAFTVALMAGAGLLFAVQPMFARFVLPLVGGSPAVWTVSVMFFQAALLAGYAYADWSLRRWGVRRQAVVHLAVVAVPLATLPIGLPDGWTPPAGGEPAWWLVGALGVGVGLPFFALATGAPVLQRWFADLPHPRAADPYFLYRASNLGSFLGLLAYPLLLEPAFGLRSQAQLWSAGYVAWAAIVALCAVVVLRAGHRHADAGAADAADARPGESEPQAAGADGGRPPLGRDYLRWITLAALPCSLLLSVTTTLTVDLAPVPLLWVVPLAGYLLTFVVAFSGSRSAGATLAAARRAYPMLALLVLVALLFKVGRPLWLVAALHLAAFAAAGLACHGRLADERPHPRYLTRFYLCLAFGGALGGVASSLVAPAVFDGLLEYPIALLLVFLFLPRRPGRQAGRWAHLPHLVPAVSGLAVAAAVVAGPARGDLGAGAFVAVLCACGLLASLALLRRPAVLGLCAAALFGIAAVAIWSAGDVLLRDRNFYGTLTVASRDNGRYHVLLHGTTLHGAQRVGSGAGVLRPTTYYNASGPLGDIVAELRLSGRTSHMAVVGLGAGTSACLAAPADTVTFYEINPLVVGIARDPALFTYLRDCPGRHEVVLGDARLSLADAPAGSYGLIVLDAFSSDAIPAHLLTREAFALYEARLSESGLIAVHVSNRYADLEPVVGRIAADAGRSCRVRNDAGGSSSYDKTPSTWAAIGGQPADFAGLGPARGWRPCRTSAPLWTDDYANVAGTLRLGR
jgi:hypothetical protein